MEDYRVILPEFERDALRIINTWPACGQSGTAFQCAILRQLLQNKLPEWWRLTAIGA
jgi:hypothetical protein